MPQDQNSFDTTSTNEKIYNDYRQVIAMVRYLDQQYYDKHLQVVPDQVYDELKLTLMAYELQYDFNRVNDDSPSGKIYDARKDYSDCAKVYPEMISIETWTNRGIGAQKVIDEFIQKVQKKLQVSEVEIVPEWKYDGIALHLDYFRGQLVRACTRRGEIITDKAFQCGNIPKVLKPFLAEDGFDTTTRHIAVRGESLIYKDDLRKLNTWLYEAGEKLYANERSAVSALARKSTYNESCHSLKFAPYSIAVCRTLNPDERFEDCLTPENSTVEKIPQFRTHRDTMIFLNKLGFEKMPTFTILTTGNFPESASANKLLLETYERAQRDRAKLPFAVDGLVYKVNDRDLQEQMGQTSHHPHWAIAHKFDAVPYRTVLRDIVFQVGRTGELSPVAVFDPITVDNTSITRAPLYNEEWINIKGLEIGQSIEVYRSGDTIPIVLGPSLTVDIRQKTFSSFEHLKGVCPCCGHSIALTVLEEPTDSTTRPRNYSCLNPGCPDRVAAAITYFAGKFNMDICGLGEATAKQLVHDFKLRNPVEIYDLTPDNLYPKGLLKTKNKKKYSQKLFDYIQGSKTKPLWCFLKSIGIPEVGDFTARSLAKRFKTFDALLDASEEDLAYTEGVGSVTAKYITRFFAGPANRSIWREKVAKLNLT